MSAQSASEIIRSGMMQRLALARALLGVPRLLLLDEPTKGLDPDGIIAMRALIRELPDRIIGTVFVSSHMLSEVEQPARDVCLIRKGSIVLHGRVSELLNGDAEVEIALDKPMSALARLAAAESAIKGSGVAMHQSSPTLD